VAALQLWIRAGKQSLSLTLTATTENGSLCERMKS
jgi:hypothetical protein